MRCEVCVHHWHGHEDGDELHEWCCRCGASIRYYGLVLPGGELAVRAAVQMPDGSEPPASAIARAQLCLDVIGEEFGRAAGLPRLHPQRRRGRRRVPA